MLPAFPARGVEAHCLLLLRALVVLLVVLPCAPLLPSCRRRCGLLTAPLSPLLLLLLCRWAERLRRARARGGGTAGARLA